MLAAVLALWSSVANAQPAPRRDAGPAAAPAASDGGARPAPTGTAVLDRAAFARRLARVHAGMTRAQVRGVMGAPDDVLTRLDPELDPGTIVTELWGWGADQHGAFPALGSVEFTAAGVVFQVNGAQGTPPPAGAFVERDLRTLFALLAEVPALEGYAFDPRPLVGAVNALQPLGASRALDAIAEYLRVAPQRTRHGTDGVFLVLRALFDPPASTGAHPPMLVGAPLPAPPSDPRVFPAFPLVIVDDVPLLLVSGYALGGEAEPPAAHLPWYRAHGAVRRAPLAPPAHALATLADFEREPRARILGTGAARAGARAMLMEQLLRLVADVYRPPLVGPGTHFDPRLDPSARWSAMAAEFDRLGARWDAARGVYVAAAGAPPARTARAPRVRWEYANRGLVIELLAERRDADSVATWVHFARRGPGPMVTGGAVELVANDGARRVLRRVEIPASGGESYNVGPVTLPAGRALTVHVDHAGQTADSPPLVP